MPLTWIEVLSDTPEGIALANQADAAFKAMPPKTVRGYADYATALGAGGILLAACQTADALHTGGPITIDKLATVLGFVPGGPLANALALAEKIEAQVKD